MKRHSSQSAFTLIELLVVISIIGLLAAIAVPILGNAQIQGRLVAALGKGRGVGQAMVAYSVQYGNFPNSPWVDPATDTGGNTNTNTAADSNVVFENLLKERIIDDKGVFYVNGSAYCKLNNGSSEADARSLKPGDNHWALVNGLTPQSDSRYPLIADGFTTTVGLYTNDESSVGGAWRGDSAIIIRVNGAADKIKLIKQGTNYYVPKSNSEKSLNMFTPTGEWLSGANIKILNPAK